MKKIIENGEEMVPAVINKNNKIIAESQFSREQIELIKKTIAIGATDDELNLFIQVCKKSGLDPFMRQIYAVKRGEKMSIQTGIDGLRLIADRTGLYAGSSDPIYDGNLTLYESIRTGQKTPTTATVTIHKIVAMDKAAFTASASWGQYYPAQKSSQFMWNKMPHLMLSKCAEALALRKAFPADICGLYTTEEMGQADSPAAVEGSQLAEKVDALAHSLVDRYGVATKEIVAVIRAAVGKKALIRECNHTQLLKLQKEFVKMTNEKEKEIAKKKSNNSVSISEVAADPVEKADSGVSREIPTLISDMEYSEQEQIYNALYKLGIAGKEAEMLLNNVSSFSDSKELWVWIMEEAENQDIEL